ncbi:hypothetical protein [uncultured Kordia sp.]|uniref:hypothetical protein n=1 Tax=uncultured Kordia sp. TaxID=507699 RepID=UPI002626EC8B|nr:hypothetical protein [uncultured Kordia sp.]
MKKKMLSFVSLGLVCTTFFLSCVTKNPDEEEQLNTVLEVPEKIISNYDAATLFQNDHITRLSQIRAEKTTFEDKTIHFELETITKYIAHLEKLATTNNIPITGVNFIFGADITGKRTTFLMPSIRNASLDYQESFTIENGEFLTFKHIDQSLKLKKGSKNDQNIMLSPNGYLSYNEAVELFNNYESQYITPFAAKVTKDYYTKAVWYSFQEIKGYISYLKKKSATSNLAITGIDVFFGVYNNDPNLELKSNTQTVFLTASTQQQSIINTKGEKFKNFIKTELSLKETNDNEGESLIFNEGNASPPPVKK